MSCRICDLPSERDVAFTSLSRAFLSPEPIAPFHLVVAVREHRPWFTDALPEEVEDVAALARKLALIAADVTDIEKFYLAAVGDVDRHFHLHLLPKRKDDPGMGPFIFGPEGWRSRLASGSESSAENVAETLRSRFASTHG